MFINPIGALVIFSLSIPVFGRDAYETVEYHLQYAMKFWNNAREEIGLKSLNKHALKDINLFYRYYHGSSVFKIQNVPLVYVHVWEAGHTVIKENLAVNMIGCSGGGDANSKEMSSALARMNEPYMMYYRELLKKHKFDPDAGQGSFMFVREPISRFLSGLNEYFFWGMNRRMALSPKELKAEIRKILNLNKFADWSEELYHSKAYPMVGSIWPGLNISFIGKLETLDSDWNILQSKFRIELQPFNHFLGFRETDRDPLKINAAYDRLAATEPYFIRALCNLLYMDFKVFRYDFPEECKDLGTVTPSHLRKPRLSGHIPNGTLIRYAKDRRVFLVKDNIKKPIFDFKVFNQYGFELDDVVTLHDKSLFESIPLGDALMR